MPFRIIFAAGLAVASFLGHAPALAQNATNGEALYRIYCIACHSIPPAGGPDRAANDPARIRRAASGGVPDMRIVGFLSDNQLADIAAWIAQAIGIEPPQPQVNYTALWWNPEESGWGINLNHQGDIVFGTLFTYDAGGAPMWLVMPAGNRQTGSTYSGQLFRTTGPAFDASPFTPIGEENLSLVGTMTVSFAGADAAALTYSVDGLSVTKSIRRQVFGSRAAECSTLIGSRSAFSNYQDLWWNAAESGWGVNLTHQDDTLFATLFTYDAAGRDLWLVLPSGARQPDGSYSGDLFRTTGPAFNANPFTPIGAENLTVVGNMRLRFADGDNGTLIYTYQGRTVTKAITRQVFASPLPACQ